MCKGGSVHHRELIARVAESGVGTSPPVNGAADAQGPTENQGLPGTSQPVGQTQDKPKGSALLRSLRLPSLLAAAPTSESREEAQQKSADYSLPGSKLNQPPIPG